MKPEKKHIVKILDSEGNFTTTEPVSLGNNLYYNISRDMFSPHGRIAITGYSDYPQGEILGYIYPGANKFYPINDKVKSLMPNLLSENKLLKLYDLANKLNAETSADILDIPNFDEEELTALGSLAEAIDATDGKVDNQLSVHEMDKEDGKHDDNIDISSLAEAIRDRWQ